MRRYSLPLLTAILGILLPLQHVLLAATPPGSQDAGAAPSGQPFFIENVGQYEDGVVLGTWGFPQDVWLVDGAVWLAWGQPASAVNLRLSFPGSRLHPRLELFDRLPTRVSFFRGSDARRWYPNAPVWGGVRYVDLYPAIDLEFAAEGGQLVQRLVARPGADLSAVQMRVEGAEWISLAPDGLHAGTAAGELTLPLLQVKSREVSASWPANDQQPWLEGEVINRPFAQSVPTSVVAADQESPILDYATFLGGSGPEWGRAIAVDQQGRAYVTGRTWSANLPATPGAFSQELNGSMDAFVARLSPSGSDLDYLTFLGGVDDDGAYGIAVDSVARAYVAGSTSSEDFPVLEGAVDATLGGGLDAFVIRLDATGSALEFATFLGGDSNDEGQGIAVDDDGSAYVTGITWESTGFPVTAGAADTVHNGGLDAFVAKFDPTGSCLEYATFLGGAGNDRGSAIALDGDSRAYITGGTDSADFPTTTGAFDRQFNSRDASDADGFVARLSASGEILEYATYLGGTNKDWGQGIAIDSHRQAHVTGYTSSPDFPTTEGAFDGAHNGDGDEDDAFVAILDEAGSALAYSTFLGGSGQDGGHAIALDSEGRVYVTGRTNYSPDFPVTGSLRARRDSELMSDSGDVFIAQFGPTGNGLLHSILVGGGATEDGQGIVLDQQGAIYLTGYTSSSDFPSTEGSFEESYQGNEDAFVLKVHFEASATATPTSTATLAATWTPVPTETATAAWTTTPSSTATNTATELIPSATASLTQAPTDFATDTPEPTETPTASATPTRGPVQLPLVVKPPQPTATPTASVTSTSSPTKTASPTATWTPTRSPTTVATPTTTRTATSSSTVAATPTVTRTPAPAWTTVLYETFEGAFPGPWQLGDNNGSVGGQYLWAKRDCRPYQGSYSAWAVGGGANGGSLACGMSYPNRAESVMIYGPFSLADATAAEMNCMLWLNTEREYDYVAAYVSVDGENFYWGVGYSGPAGAWGPLQMDFGDIYGLGSTLGQPHVWVGLWFVSGTINTLPEGVYVDNILIRKCTSPSCP